MGLLDDAIREHLELRRRAGADASEVARLEQEALGPVVRAGTAEPEAEFADANEQQLSIEGEPPAPPPPGEPVDYEQAAADFHEHEQAPDPDAQVAAEPPPVPRAPSDDDPALSRQPGTDPPPVEAASEPEHLPLPAAAGQATEEYDVEAVHAAQSIVEEQAPAEPAAEPHVAHPPEDAPAESKRQPEATETAAVEEQHPPHHDGEPEVERSEHHDGEREVERSEHHDGEREPEQPDKGEPGGEDVLEQTPEFLQETPEHDRLWFEQAPPKDFDFDR